MLFAGRASRLALEVILHELRSDYGDGTGAWSAPEEGSRGQVRAGRSREAGNQRAYVKGREVHGYEAMGVR